jgi:hypothetical protein
VDADRVADGFKTHGGARPNSTTSASSHPTRALQSQLLRTSERVCRTQGFGPGVEGIGPTEPIDHIESFAYLSFAVSRLFGIAADARR